MTAIPFNERPQLIPGEGTLSVSDINPPLPAIAGRSELRGGSHFRKDAASPVLTRRSLLKLAGGAAVLAAGGEMVLGQGLRKATQARTIASSGTPIEYVITASDGWISMPKEVADMPPFYPDPWGPATGDPDGSHFTSFVFGFRDMTGIDPGQLVALGKGKSQLSAPIIHCQVGDDLRLTLKNLGYGWIPQNPDNHTIHFHGFPNQIAYFDGVPDASLAAAPGHELAYRYIPEDPGTYMWHCHIDDVEHVNMGLYGLVYVSPRDPAGSPAGTGLWMAYDDPTWTSWDATKSRTAQLQTAFDRQFPFMVSELFQQGHFNDRHTQDTDWTDYNGTFRLLNGRAWPDTIAESINPLTGEVLSRQDGSGTGTYNHRLQYQPNSSLVQGISGERILLRLSNLGFEEHSIVLPDLPFTLIGQDAKFLGTGRPDYDVYVNYNADSVASTPGALTPNGTRGSAETTSHRIDIGPGESRDVLITLPQVGALTKFPMYDREYGYANPAVAGPGGYGGLRTEVWVYPTDDPNRPAPQDPVKNRQNTIFPTA